MAGELHAKVGAKGKHNSERVAARHGRQPGRVVLGCRTVRVSRPRARTVDGGEVELQTYRAFQDPDLLGEMAFERMVAGLSTRRYQTGLEPVGELDASGTSKAAVSRRFVHLTAKALGELMSRDLSDTRLVALFCDGIELAEHCCVVALGVDDQGRKHPLALREGTTENAAVCRAMLADLVERGLRFGEGSGRARPPWRERTSSRQDAGPCRAPDRSQGESCGAGASGRRAARDQEAASGSEPAGPAALPDGPSGE